MVSIVVRGDRMFEYIRRQGDADGPGGGEI